jgi:SAM-dependent methyltransferase
MLTFGETEAWFEREHPELAAPAQQALSEEAFGFLRRKCEAEGRTIENACEALARLSVSRALHSPEPASGSARATDEDDLDGRLLSYAFWLNRTLQYRFFVEDFLAALPSDARIGELGTGPGLLGLTALRRLPEARYDGFDPSASSLTYAEGLLRANGVTAGRARLHQGAVLAGMPARLGPLQAVICCDAIQHLSDPLPLLRGLRAALAPDARVFVTTVTRLEASEPIYAFADAAHVRRVVAAAGFQVERELAMPLPGVEHMSLPAVDYAAVLRLKDGAA